jgi:hypothetical protein
MSMTKKAELSEAAKHDRKALRDTYETAYQLFLENMETAPTPKDWPLPYAIAERVQDVEWRTAFMGMQVNEDTSELINELNLWRENLLLMSIWIGILKDKPVDDDEAWSIQRHFVDPLAFHCLFQPSATRDRFGLVAETAMHQANLTVKHGYKDRLVQDDDMGGKKKRNRHLSRSEREKQLKSLGKGWKAFSPFKQALGMIDNKAYRKQTVNFRNRASHGIAPRFRIGITNFITRRVVPATKIETQPDGTVLETEIPGKLAVSYGIGGTPPLRFEDVYEANMQQYSAAVRTFRAYEKLLGEMMEVMPEKPPCGDK